MTRPHDVSQLTTAEIMMTHQYKFRIAIMILMTGTKNPPMDFEAPPAQDPPVT